MGLDLSRRRFIIGAFASVAGVAATVAIERAVFIPKPKLDWDDMLVFLRKSLEPRMIGVIDHSTAYASFMSVEYRGRMLAPPKMFVGWHTPEWRDMTAEQQQGSAEFIEENIISMVRERQRPFSIAGREESQIECKDLGLWAHADT